MPRLEAAGGHGDGAGLNDGLDDAQAQRKPWPGVNFRLPKVSSLRQCGGRRMLPLQDREERGDPRMTLHESHRLKNFNHQLLRRAQLHVLHREGRAPSEGADVENVCRRGVEAAVAVDGVGDPGEPGAKDVGGVAATLASMAGSP